MNEPNQLAGVNDQKVIDDTTTVTTSRANKEQQQAVTEYSKHAKGNPTMKVRIYSPYNDYYDGEAFSLSAESATGSFDILPKHHNFISLLLASEVVVRTVNKGENRIRISGGLIHVKADQVIVFLDV